MKCAEILRLTPFVPLGRFLQPDQLGFAADPTNLYRYCGNNPTNSVDPYGLYQVTIIGADGLGGYVTWGSNSGVFNWGGGVGWGEGLSVRIDFGDQGSHKPGDFFGIVNSEGVGNPTAGLGVSVYIGNDQQTIDASVRVGLWGKGGKFNTNGGAREIGPALILGGATFTGFRGVSYRPQGDTSPSTPPPPAITRTEFYDANGNLFATGPQITVVGTPLRELGIRQFGFGYGTGSGLNSGSLGGASFDAVMEAILMTKLGIPGGGPQPGEGTHPVPLELQ